MARDLPVDECTLKKTFEDINGVIRTVNRRTDNKLAKRKRTKTQNNGRQNITRKIEDQAKRTH